MKERFLTHVTCILYSDIYIYTKEKNWYSSPDFTTYPTKSSSHGNHVEGEPAKLRRFFKPFIIRHIQVFLGFLSVILFDSPGF